MDLSTRAFRVANMAGGSGATATRKSSSRASPPKDSTDDSNSNPSDGRQKLLCLDFDRAPVQGTSSEPPPSNSVQFSQAQFNKLLGTVAGLADRLDAVEASKRPTHDISDEEDDDDVSSQDSGSESDHVAEPVGENPMDKLGESHVCPHIISLVFGVSRFGTWFDTSSYCSAVQLTWVLVF